MLFRSMGELEIAYRISRGNFVAITGTNGKTTTTTLTGEIFKNSGRRTYVAGNIGTAVISATTTADENDWLVTETSSFQLETTRYFRPVVSAVLNITPDHLNRHRTMEAYAGAKAKVFANQSGESYLVINPLESERPYRQRPSCRCGTCRSSSSGRRRARSGLRRSPNRTGNRILHSVRFLPLFTMR